MVVDFARGLRGAGHWIPNCHFCQALLFKASNLTAEVLLNKICLNYEIIWAFKELLRLFLTSRMFVFWFFFFRTFRNYHYFSSPFLRDSEWKIQNQISFFLESILIASACKEMPWMKLYKKNVSQNIMYWETLDFTTFCFCKERTFLEALKVNLIDLKNLIWFKSRLIQGC